MTPSQATLCQRRRCIQEIEDFVRLCKDRTLSAYELRLLCKMAVFLAELDLQLLAVPPSRGLAAPPLPGGVERDLQSLAADGTRLAAGFEGATSSSTVQRRANRTPGPQ